MFKEKQIAGYIGKAVLNIVKNNVELYHCQIMIILPEVSLNKIWDHAITQKNTILNILYHTLQVSAMWTDDHRWPIVHSGQGGSQVLVAR